MLSSLHSWAVRECFATYKYLSNTLQQNRVPISPSFAMRVECITVCLSQEFSLFVLTLSLLLSFDVC